MISRFLVVALLCLTVGTSYSQFFYNGDFKYYRPNYIPLQWYILGTDNEALVDTSTLFEGKNTLRVRSNTPYTRDNSVTIIQQADISKWPKHSRVKASCYLSFLKGDTSNFHFFVNNNPCVVAYHNKYAKITLDTIYRSPRIWIKLTLERDIDTVCNQLFLGFIAYYGFDFNVSSWELFINDQKVIDVPIYPKPLPDWKDRNFLQATAFPIPDIRKPDNKDVTAAFQKVMGNSRVIALGEGTHGTREFNQLRTGIINHLIDSCGFNTLVFEEDPVSMDLAWNALQTGAMPISNIVDSYFINVHDNNETKELLEGLAGRMAKKKELLLCGADMQKTYWALLFMQGHPLNNIPFDSGVSEIAKYTLHDSTDYERAFQICMRLSDQFKLIGRSMGEKQRAIYGRALTALSQCVGYQAHMIRGRSFFRMSHEEAILAFNYRDSCMAENVLRLLRTDSTRKIMIWIHNSHIRKLPDTVSAALNARYMGGYLTDSIGSQYKAFALTTAEGTLRGAQYWRLQVDTLDKPDADCYEYYFSKTGFGAFFWPLIGGHPAITENLRFRSLAVGRPKGVDSFKPLSLLGNFDGIFFINKTSWAQPVPSQKMRIAQ